VQLNTALDHLKSAVRLDRSNAKFRHSLGKAYEAAEQWQAALEHYQFAVDTDPFATEYQMAMVKPLTRLRRLARVVEARRAALRCIVHRSRNLLCACIAVPEAPFTTFQLLSHSSDVQVCKSVLALEPSHPKANFKCASALRQQRLGSDALAYYRRHLKTDPDDEQAHFWISVLSGEAVSHAPAAHVASLFDYYAPNFEEHLVEALQYRTPATLVQALKDAATMPEAKRENGGRQSWGCCADLGCGTGLMGPLLRAHVSSLDGVDLSSKMLDKAREKGCYDRLFVEDAVDFLSEQRARGHDYDVIVAADVLVYIGDLEPLLSAASGVSEDRGLLAFSTESATAEDAVGDSGYKATITGRFKHDRVYVEKVSAAHGWTLLKHTEARIRCNAGQPVTGDLFVMMHTA
jgi:predicted TPR repeat methyltransferase